MRLNNKLLLLLFLITCQYVKAQIDTSINIGPCQLQFKIIKGKGTAILFENGGAMDLSQWSDVILKIHTATGATIITYNRQGFGKSGLDTLHYNLKAETEGLERALNQLGYINTPFISVCHSLGNFYSSFYISRHPYLAKGIIMLDPRISSQATVVLHVK